MPVPASRPQLPRPPRPLEGVPFTPDRYKTEVRALYRDMDGLAAITAHRLMSSDDLESLRRFVAQANELLQYREGSAPVAATGPAVREEELCVA